MNMNTTTIYSSTEPPDLSTEPPSDLSTGEIIGIVALLGTIVTVGGAIVTLVACCRKKIYKHCLEVHIPNEILNKEQVSRGEKLIIEATTTLGKLEYEWNPSHVSQDAENSYTIPDTPNQDEVEYSCKITPKHCFRKSRSREVKFICPPNVPSAPPNYLRVTGRTSSSVDLCWEPPPTEKHNGQLTGYTIKIKDENGDEPQPPLHDVPADRTSKQVDGLKPNTKYTFEVRAKTAAGSGPAVSIEKCTTEGVPSAPNNLRVTGLKSSSVDLRWDPPPAEQHNGQLTGYTIKVKDQNRDEPRYPLHVPADCLSKHVDDLKPYTNYTFEVRAKTAAGSGPAASIKKRTAEGVPSAPPTSLCVTNNNSSSVHLSWKPPPEEQHNGELTGYIVVVKNQNDHDEARTTETESTSIDINDLQPDTEYVFQVSARTEAGGGPTTSATQRTEVDYYSIFAERYEELNAKEKTDSVLPDVKFVCPVLFQCNADQNYATPGMDIDKIPGEKIGINYDHLLEEKEKGSRILLQGRPGCGKSRLMKQISCKLANKNRNGRFVIFVKLRELSEKKFDENNQLKYLLCTAGVDLSDAAKETLLSSKFNCQDKGSNVIFLFDGFDECDPKHESTDLIRKIFMKTDTAFENSTVIMSSRPSATRNFQKKKHIEVVEIFGFKKAEVFTYLQNVKSLTDAKKEILTKHLQDNPTIMNMCYLPLYCAMLVDLSERVKDVKELPKTESEFYEHFTLSTWNRYIRRDNQPRQLSKFVNLKDKDNFKEICKFAYDRTKDSQQEFTADNFSEKQDFDLLVSKQIVVPVGSAEVMSYSFVHLTFQEYLTAIYIAWYLEESQQDAIVTEHCSERAFLVVWQFLFGILKPYSDELFSKIQGATPDEHMLHVRCAYESQHRKACDKVLVFHDHSLKLIDIYPSDLPCLTYVLESIDTPIAECKLKFRDCNFGEKDALTFLEGVGHHQLSLTVKGRGEAAQSMLNALCDVKVPGLKELEIIGDISRRPRRTKGSIHKNCSNLKSLTLAFVDTSNLGLEEGLKHSWTSLETLSLSRSSIGSGVKALSEGIRNWKELKTLHLRHCQFDVKDAEMLGDILSQASWIQSIDLLGNRIGSGVKALSEGIRNCKELKTLILANCGFGVNEAEMLGDLLSHASWIQSIDLSLSPLGDGVPALLEGIRKCEQLKELCLEQCVFGVKEADSEMLGEILSHASCIQKINLSGNPLGDGGPALLEGIRKCEQLKELELIRCELRDDAGIIRLIESIGKLEKLYISRNKFTHDQVERLKKAVTERNSKEGMTKLESRINFNNE